MAAILGLATVAVIVKRVESCVIECYDGFVSG
jgi:hypothetical protein